MIEAVAQLFAIIGLGTLCTAVGFVPSPKKTITLLNRYALYIAFPLLIIASLSSDQLELRNPGAFIAVHVLSALLILLFVALVGRFWIRDTGRALVVATGAIFGNIAYLGIPFCAAVLGDKATSVAAVSAAIHIVIAMTAGAAFLARASQTRQASWQLAFTRVAKQPLLWSPFLGLLLRIAPDLLTTSVRYAAVPIGNTAGPVALFMLGIYLWINRRRVTEVGVDAALISAAKLIVYPAISLAVLMVVARFSHITLLEGQVFILVAAMPVAITTFALAEEFKAGQAELAAAIVVTTLAGLALLPVWAAWLISLP